MAKGFFIRQGDQTCCGGQVLEGDGGWLADGAPLAKEGDLASCGVDGETYAIVGGIAHFHLNGRRAAGTLDSITTCPCEASLIASSTGMAYDQGEAPTPRSSVSDNAAARATEPLRIESASQRHSGLSSSHPPSRASAPGTAAQEPGFHIVEKSTSREQLLSTVLAGMSPAAHHKFHSLNPGSDLIKAGSLIVLSDPNNYQCTREEALLMSAATSANQALESLSAEEADFMMRHRDEIATFLSYSSTSVGVGTAMYARHLKELEKILKNLEALHARSFARDGHLRSAGFFAERKQLLSQLDVHLGSMTRKGVGIADHPSLKSALGLSTRSLVHHWSKAGGAGQIPGYATHLKGVATASNAIKGGGWIGIGIGGVAAYQKVQAVCSAGDSDSCERVKFTETGSFLGGVVAGTVVGAGSSTLATGVCVGIGVTTAGIGGILCGVVVVGAVSYGVGRVGEQAGEHIGDLIYRSTR